MIIFKPNMTTSSVANKLPDESQKQRGSVLDVLRQLLAERQDDAVIEMFSKLVAQNEQLHRQLAEMLVRRKKGEGVSTAQLKLFLDELAADDDEELEQANQKLVKAAGLDQEDDVKKKKKKPRKQPKNRRHIPEQLRRVDNPINVPEGERPCPVCGKERECIGHEVTEVIDLIPAEVVVRRDIREKLACKSCEGELVRAPKGDKIVDGGMFSCRFVSHLLVDKYRDGLPLNRQKQRYEKLGLPVSIATLADQVTWTTDILRPLWRAASAVVLGSAVMQMDGTGIAVLDRNHPANLKMGNLWGYIGDDVTALYLYNSTGKKRGQRKGELGPEDMLSMRSGYTVADASNLFDASFLRKDLIECGCNMHARRYFKKALDAGDTRMALAIGVLKKLYEIEEKIRAMEPPEKLEVRKKESEPIYDELVAWVKAHRPHEPPKTPTGQAFQYLINHEFALRRFLENGKIPMDNGAVERLHIRVALTRKNYLFAGSDTGAERAAIAYTILGCCALAEVNPLEYLPDVLSKLSRGIRLRDAPDLLPARWKEARGK